MTYFLTYLSSVSHRKEHTHSAKPDGCSQAWWDSFEVLQALGIFPDQFLAVGTDRTGMDKIFLFRGGPRTCSLGLDCL